MKISDKHFSILIAVAIVISSYALATKSSSSIDALDEKIGYIGVPCIQVTRVNGNVEPQICTHNLITNGGKEWVKKAAMGGGSQLSNWTRLAVGGNTSAELAATDITLANIWVNCGLTNATGTQTSMGTGNWSIWYQWTATCDSAQVNNTGIYNFTSEVAGAASGNLLAEARWTPSTQLMNGDKINVTYYTWVA